MSISFEVLGEPGRDNALFLKIESGQRTSRLLFDCGDNCLSGLSISEIQSINHLFFSHFHMDHVAGFDTFFRCNFNRTMVPNMIWGPAGAATILHHRFRGYLWNLLEGQGATWTVNDVDCRSIDEFRFELADAFEERCEMGSVPIKDEIIFDDEDFCVSTIALKHHGTSLGYLVREKPRFNVDMSRLAELNLTPGPWLKLLKQDDATAEVSIEDTTYKVEELRDKLLVETAGESIAYLTDFLLDEETFGELKRFLSDVQIVVSEAQYCRDDKELAKRHDHTTVDQVGRLAAAADINQLVLFHLSSRYDREQWLEMLEDCRTIFPATDYPEKWSLTL